MQHLIHDAKGSHLYDDDAPEVIEIVLDQKKQEKLSEISFLSIKALNRCAASHPDHKKNREAVLAGIGRRGRSSAQTLADFRAATEEHLAIQDKRDDLLKQIQDATTIDELAAITW